MAEYRPALDLQPGPGFAKTAGSLMNPFSRALRARPRTAITAVKGDREGIGAAMPNSALFLARDGVIRVDHRYVHPPDQCELTPPTFGLAPFDANRAHPPSPAAPHPSS